MILSILYSGVLVGILAYYGFAPYKRRKVKKAASYVDDRGKIHLL
jgi:hypothetical protein